MWQQPPGKEPGPVSVTRILRDPAPRPGSGRVLRFRRGTWTCDPGGGQGCTEHVQPHRPPITVPLYQQWFSPRHPLAIAEAGSPGTIPLVRRRGTYREAGLVAMATGRSPRAELGAGRPREALSRAQIRTQEGVGPAPSRGPEPGPGSPGICQVPGRARAPGRLVPTSPAAAPEAPTAASLSPTQLLWGCVLPSPARPSLAGPRLPAGLGRTSPPARQGAEGRANASRRPRRRGGLARLPPSSGGVPFL